MRRIWPEPPKGRLTHSRSGGRTAGRRPGKAAAFLILLLSAGGISLGWKEQAHKDQLTALALKLIHLHDGRKYGREIWETFAPFTLQGAWDEDFPCSLKTGIRANNHYYHPLRKRGLSGSAIDAYATWLDLGDPDVDTLTWAETNARFSVKEEFDDGKEWKFGDWGWTADDVDYGDMSWKRAVERYGYTAESKRLAYYTLGFICHLLQDMGCPEHVHDDPHGASGYTGFEMWVYKNWDSLQPPLGGLRPLRLKSLAGFFTHLAKLGYSIDRFHGGILDPKKGAIEGGTDLGRMFKVGYSAWNNEWRLENFSGERMISPAGRSSVTGSPNLSYKWNWGNYRRKPLDTKGGDGGEWWPTSLEFPATDFGGDDEEGYYYLELSGEVPGDPLAAVADPRRNLYPAAFLPTPLKDVAGEASGWRVDDSRGEHLYSLIGRKIAPPIVEHTAGLIEHFYDIVNPPPYVSAVQAWQDGVCVYSVLYDHNLKRPLGSQTITDIESRKLVNDPSRGGGRDFLKPGRATLSVFFSEPVSDVAVRIGGRSVTGALEEEGMKWAGRIVIAEEGPRDGELRISISAMDLDNHYGNAGGLLDADPRTPAKRIVGGDDYEWIRYEAGDDENHRIKVKREDQAGQTYTDGKGVKVFVPCGKLAFANVLVSYGTGNPAPVPAAAIPSQALGEPDFDNGRDTGYVTLGCGGSIVLAFTGVRLVDVPGPDLYVFEIGPDVEPTELEISKDGGRWIKIGRLSGGKASADIGPFASPGDQFRYIRLTDLKTACRGNWPGADIDAVAAIGCVVVK